MSLTKKHTKHKITIPNDFNELKTELELLLNKNDKIINTYLEHTVYTSAISDTNKVKLKDIYEKNHKLILDTFT